MKKTTRILAMALALVMALGLLPITAGAAFTATRTYKSGQFTDVADSAWFAKDVKKVYELGLMNGNSTTTFNPKGMFTVAEALTVAGRMHHLANGGSGTLPKASGAWYQGAVNYCLAQGIITRGQFDSYTRNATRAEMAGVVRAALPDGQWKAINSVSALPDVSAGTDYSQAIFDLYNAGVFTGNDKYGMFQPYANITRAEVAAIVARCADPGQRKTLNLKPLSERQAPEILGGWKDVSIFFKAQMANGRLPYQDPDTQKWGFLDGNGKAVIPAEYDSVENFRGGYAVVEKGKKYGVINTAGTVTVPLVYHSFSSQIDILGNGLFRMRDGNKFGVVNGNGKTIVPFQYSPDLIDFAWNIVGRAGFFAWGKTKGGFDIYDQNGNKVAENAKLPSNGNPLIVIKEGSKCAVATGSTKFTEAVYDDVELPENADFAIVHYGNLKGLVGLAGEIFAPGTYDDFEAKGEYVIVKKDGKTVGIADVTGILPGNEEDYLPQEDTTYADVFSQDYYQIKSNDIGKPCLYYGSDTNGWTSVIEFYKNSMYYDEIRELGEGYYACRFNTTWYLLHA